MTSRPPRFLARVLILCSLGLIVGLVVFFARRTTPHLAAASAAEASTSVVDYQGVPLSRVVAVFNRQNRIQIILGSPGLENMQISGRFSLDQPTTFVKLVETGLELTSEPKGDAITLRQAK